MRLGRGGGSLGCAGAEARTSGTAVAAARVAAEAVRKVRRVGDMGDLLVGEGTTCGGIVAQIGSRWERKSWSNGPILHCQPRHSREVGVRRHDRGIPQAARNSRDLNVDL